MNFADLPLTSLIQALSFTPALVFECAFTSRTGPDPRSHDLERMLAASLTQPESPIRTTIALSAGEHGTAAALVGRRYASRGYVAEPADGITSCRAGDRRGYFTLLAYQGTISVGTVTLGFDSGEGLYAEKENASEVYALRSTGRRVCEMIRLAVDEGARSKQTLAALFNAAYGLGRAHSATDLIIEVNPRHVPFYTRALNFEIIAPERVCRRVNAPSVLMRLDIDVLSKRIQDLRATLEDVPL